MFTILIQRTYTANVSLYRVDTFSAAKAIGTPQYGEVVQIFNNLNQRVRHVGYDAPFQCFAIVNPKKLHMILD